MRQQKYHVKHIEIIKINPLAKPWQEMPGSPALARDAGQGRSYRGQPWRGRRAAYTHIHTAALELLLFGAHAASLTA